MRRVAFAVLALIPFAAPSAAPQQSAPPQEQRPTFRGSSVFVNVDVYPRRDGRVLENLTKDDFEVFEDGKPQPIEKFEFIRVAPFTPDAEKRDPNTITESQRLAADPYSRLFIIFLDRYNVSLFGSHYARDLLVNFLNRTIGPNDLFAVMTPDVPLERLTFVRRSETIANELSKYWDWGEDDRLTEMAQTDEEHKALNCAPYGPSLPALRRERAATTLDRMVAKMGALRDARTNVLFVSEGWIRRAALPPDRGTSERPTLPRVGPTLTGALTSRLGAGGDEYGNLDRNGCELWKDRLARIDFERRFRDLLGAAQRANVAFYSIDVGGLKTGLPNAKDSTDRRGELSSRLDTLQSLANETGGFAIVNTNDLAGGVKKISDDLSAFYLLGYYSTNSAADGKFRRIEVRVKPQDVKVSARRGYAAPTPEMLKAEAAAASTPARVRTGADDARERLGRIRGDAKLYTAATATPTGLDVIVELSSSEMASFRWNAGAAVTVSVMPKAGGTAASAQGKIAAGTRSVILPVAVAAAPGTAWRITAQASVPDVLKDVLEDALDVTVPEASPLGEPAVFRAMPSPRSTPQPSADPLYRRTERIHVRWAGTGLQGTDLDQRVARLLGANGDPLPVPVSLTERDEAGRKVIVADLVLAPLAAGDYVIELSAKRGAETLTSHIAFRVTR